LLLAILTVISAAIYYVKLSPKTAEQVNEKIANGKLVELTERSLKIKVPMPSRDGNSVRGQSSEEEIIYNINNQTKFYRYSEQVKSIDEYNQEVAEFNKKIKQLSAEKKNIIGMEPPTFYNQETIKPQDIKIGEFVSLYIDRERVNDLTASLTKVVADKATNTNVELIKTPLFKEKLIGNIQAVSGNRLSILIEPADPLFASSSEPSLHEFVLDNNVKFFKQQPKKQEQYRLEQSDFNKKINQLVKEGKPIAGLEPPSPDVNEAITLSELRPGQTIVVTTEISEEKTTVIEISVLPQR